MNSLIANRFIHFAARIARKLPILVKTAKFLGIKKPELRFSSSGQYWQERYEQGGNSGEGSYGALSTYKAEFINGLVTEKKISSVIEFGCGDGNQASLFTFPNYTGVDISAKCIENCRNLLSKSGYKFILLDDYLSQKANDRFDLSISLDVIYHLIEDEIYDAYLANLFESSSRYTLIYASNFEHFSPELPHVRHRQFSRDVADRFPEWELVETFDNPYAKPHSSKEYGSFAKFFLFRK